MIDLLKGLGLRVRRLREAKKWSQEEFAHIAGFHRTYIGQIERGEKNLSFTNLAKIASVLDLRISELLMGVEDVAGGSPEEKTTTKRAKLVDAQRQILEIRKLAARLGHQRTELNRTIQALEDLVAGDSKRS